MTKREMVLEYLQSHPKATAREVARNTTASLSYVKAVALDIAGKCNPGKGCWDCPFARCVYNGKTTPEERELNKAAWKTGKRLSEGSGKVRHGKLSSHYSKMEYADFLT